MLIDTCKLLSTYNGNDGNDPFSYSSVGTASEQSPAVFSTIPTASTWKHTQES